MLNKLIALSILLMFSFSSFADDNWYVGVGYGKAKLTYNTKKALDDSIDKSVTSKINQINSALSSYTDKINTKLVAHEIEPISTYSVSVNNTATELKNSVNLTESYDQNSYNFYVGYKVTKRLSVELGQQHYTSFQAQANLPVNIKINRSISSEDQLATLNATGNVTALATETASMTVTTLVMAYDVFKTDHTNLFVKLGAGYGNASLVSNEQYSYSYNYKGCINEDCDSGSNSATFGQKTKSSSFAGYLPVYGIGAEYNLTKTSAVRVEAVRLGTSDIHVDSITAGMLVRF